MVYKGTHSSTVMMSGTGELLMDGANSSDVCSEYETKQFKMVAAIRASVGLFSTVCSLAVVLLIVAYKKYRVYPQRLILYLAISASLHSFSYTVARINYYTPRKILDPYCYFSGYYNNYTNWLEVLSICYITFDLLVNVVFHRRTEKYEFYLAGAVFLSPALWSWVPFIQLAYGTAGPWCGIRVVDENCEPFEFGIILRFALWYIPLYIILAGTTVTTLLVFCKVQRDVHKWEGVYSPEKQDKKKQLKREVQSLIWYPVIYLLLNTFSFINRIYDTANPNDPLVVLWYLHVVSSPLRGAVIALIYALDSETVRLLKCSNLKKAYVSCCKEEVDEYMVHYMEFGDSIDTKSHTASS